MEGGRGGEGERGGGVDREEGGRAGGGGGRGGREKGCGGPVWGCPPHALGCRACGVSSGLQSLWACLGACLTGPTHAWDAEPVGLFGGLLGPRAP